MGPEKVEAYKLSNGQIVENHEDAIRLQREIDFEKAVWEFANEHGCYSDGVNLIGRTLLDNADELKEIFKPLIF